MSPGDKQGIPEPLLTLRDHLRLGILSFPPPDLLRYNWQVYEFKVYNVLIWYTYILQSPTTQIESVVPGGREGGHCITMHAVMVISYLEGTLKVIQFSGFFRLFLSPKPHSIPTCYLLPVGTALVTCSNSQKSGVGGSGSVPSRETGEQR